jgi:tRNA G18 (ribose-2'-O)-methylase SpoU
MIKKLSHQQIQKNKPTIGQVKKMARTPVHVVLDNIRSIYNVGAMFRTSDAILAEKLYLCGITGHPPRPDLDKVALGATEVVPWEYHESAVETVKMLKKANIKICALELTEKSRHYREAEYPFPMALVLGNEVDGVSDEVMKYADMAIYLPMLGRANSLNVATAYGIVGYEILYQYEKILLKKAL